MYEAFFQLNEKPFGMQPDPDYFFLSERHGFAFTMLEYAIANQADFAMITGEIGAGKTTLIRHLLRNLPDGYEVGVVTNTHPDMGDLLQWLLLAFELKQTEDSAVSRYEQFQHFLLETYSRGKSVLLVIDEAQNLSRKALEAVRLLSNINVDKHSILQIVLAGQPQLRQRLQEPELEQFAQRISVDFNLPALKPEEVQQYIEHRLHVAGRDAPLFTAQACERIAAATSCIPRKINILCDTTLVFAFGKGARLVDSELIDEVISTLAKAVE